MTELPYSVPDALSDCVGVVTGAASGIGRAAAARLADHGVKLLLIDREEAALTEVLTELRGRDADVDGAVLDLAEPTAVRAAVSTAHARWGSVDIAVNCVGITGETGRRSHEVELANFDSVIAVNLRAAFIFSQEVLPIMLAQRYGRVLHVASIAGKEGNAGMVAYSSSKAGLVGMVKAQGKEYAGDGITFNALAPAVIWTPLVEAMPEAQVQYMTERIPMGRCGTLAEVADMISFIVSPQNSFCTCFTFDLSGGRATY
jgi:2-dehydro-3-deoxy-L-rhamnonate dehydrogenase (NAD+)